MKENNRPFNPPNICTKCLGWRSSKPLKANSKKCECPRIDPRITEARRLMFQVTQDRRKKEKEAIDNSHCKCGHKRKHHSDSYSINYTGGFCSKCECQNFLHQLNYRERKHFKL